MHKPESVLEYEKHKFLRDSETNRLRNLSKKIRSRDNYNPPPKKEKNRGLAVK